jgi:NAD(P)-dependent dehydrogenase (short-subunit alcohol dehydrogenase family)
MSAQPDLPLRGRTALVTGASRGIGAAIAQRLASAGATVIAAARTVEGDPAKGTAKATADIINGRGGKAFAMPLDLEDPASREALISGAIAKLGRIDILVNNAGTAAYIATDEMPLATAEAQTQTYLLGPWHLCNLILPHMKKNGGGWILTVGSCSVEPPTRPYDAYVAGRGNETLYATLKAAVHRLSTGLAAEVYADNIAVNVVAPVLAIFTPGLASLNLGLTAESEICEPIEDIAEASVELLSHPQRECTGQVEFSYQFLDRIGRSTMSLDGKTVMKDRSKQAHHV